jgi:glutamate carboxypeptidase
VTALASDLLVHLRSRQSEMVDLLRRLALLESPTLVPEAQAPVQALLAAELAPFGYRARRLPGVQSGGPLVLARRPGRTKGRPGQMIVGHSDTVWACGTVARMPVELRGGRLYGPGVYDMKGGLAQVVFALRALAELGLEPPLAPYLFVSSDEEIGSLESRRPLERLARRMQRVFLVEPSLGPDGRLKTARKGSLRFTITVHGKAAHSGLEPEKGASAVSELAHIIRHLDALAEPARGLTVNVGVIAGGLRANVVAPEARAEVDIRVLRREDVVAVERAVFGMTSTVPGTRIEVRGGEDRPPFEPSPRNRALWERAREAAAELGIALEEATAGGSSDGNFTSRLAATLDGLGAVGDGAHAQHEHVEIDRMPERAALLALLLLAPVESAG